MLKLVSKPEVIDDTKDELTIYAESETDAEEFSGKDEFRRLVLGLSATKETRNELKKQRKPNIDGALGRRIHHRSQVSVPNISRGYSRFIP